MPAFLHAHPERLRNALSDHLCLTSFDFKGMHSSFPQWLLVDATRLFRHVAQEVTIGCHDLNKVNDVVFRSQQLRNICAQQLAIIPCFQRVFCSATTHRLKDAAKDLQCKKNRQSLVGKKTGKALLTSETQAKPCEHSDILSQIHWQGENEKACYRFQGVLMQENSQKQYWFWNILKCKTIINMSHKFSSTWTSQTLSSF